jgi:TolB-like protein
MARFSAKNLLKEARRRRVFRTIGLYIVGAWLVVQIALAVFPALSISETAIRYIWTAALLGFPLAVVFGWRYDIRGGRVERTASTRTDVSLSLGRGDFLLLGALGVIATAILASSLWEISTTKPEQGASFVPTDVDINSVAVLPFLNMSSDPEQEYFSDGITEEVLNLLVKIPELKVTSRTSVFSFKGQSIDIPTVAQKLGVAHILEGSVRRAGDRIRITAQFRDSGRDSQGSRRGPPYPIAW